VVVPGGAADPPLCTCGAELAHSELAGGVYELRKSRRATRRRGTKSEARPTEPIAKEPDLGYGESHGYGPAHGGPSGPGDAPAATGPTSSRDVPDA